MSAALRLFVIGWVLVRYDALAPREIAALAPAPVRMATAVLRLLARACERLGPAAIKLGQLLSTRADVFGLQFADDLAGLKDRLPPFPTEVAVAEVEAGLGRPLASLYATFDPPVAAASLAQAHPATLLDGRRVAVKVLRPGVERRVAGDVAAMRLGAALAETFVPPARRLEPRAFVAAVAKSMIAELDLRMEAAAASEMAEVMAHDGYMRAPAVVWEGVARRVLTLEWAQGVPMREAGGLAGLDGAEVGVKLVRAFLSQALDHGVFHADLHEGNLFVEAPSTLTAVDFGIVGRLGPNERRFLAEILWGFLRRDYRRIAEVHVEAGYVPRVHAVDDFAQALRAVGEPIFGRTARDVSMGRLLGQLFEVTGRFDMHLRPELVLLQKTMVTVEGVARRIDPQHDLWAAARPVVERWIRRELSPVARLHRLAEHAGRIGDALARQAETPAPVTVVRVGGARLGWAALAVAAAALAVAATALWR